MLGVWESGFPGSCVAAGTDYSCMKIWGGNQPGKAQGFQGTRQAQNDSSDNSALAAGFPSIGLPCVETTVCFPLTFPITGLNRDL